MKKAIITQNLSGHNFNIGDEVELMSRHRKYFRCKGASDAHYYIRIDELKIIG